MNAKQTKNTCAIYSSIYINDSTNNMTENNFLPVKASYTGDLKYSIVNSNHDGWFLCNGQTLSRTHYSKLFNIIGTNFGVGDGSTTFNLPDARGRVVGLIGQGSTLTNRTMGNMIGSETHTLTIDEMPSHSHTINDPGHSHGYTNNVNNQNTDNAFGTETAADETDLSQTTSSSTTGITINSNGGGLPHNNMQPTLFICNLFIFAL